MIIDTSASYVAAKKFTLDGKAYAQGDAVSLDGKSTREIERLARHRFIRVAVEQGKAVVTAVGGGGMHAPGKDKLDIVADTVADDSVAADSDDAPVADTVADEPEAEATPVADDRTVTLKSTGGGYYEALDASGVNVLPEKVQGKDNCKLVLEQLGYTVK